MAECENFEVVEMHRRQSHKEGGELHAALENMKAIGKPGKYAINERTDAGVGDTDNYLFLKSSFKGLLSYQIILSIDGTKRVSVPRSFTTRVTAAVDFIGRHQLHAI